MINENTAQKILKDCQKAELIFIGSEGGILFSKVEETIKELSQENSLYIVSNCQKGYIEVFFKFYNLNKYFKDFECAGNTNLNKAENIKIIMGRNNIKKAIYIGDMAMDEEATLKNHIPFIYASYGFGKSNRFTYKIDEFRELKELCYNLAKKGK